MATEMAVETAARELPRLVERMHRGETVRLVDSDGNEVAVLISTKPSSEKHLSADEWGVRWRALAERIDKAWKSDKTALEILAEMRR